MTNRDGEKLLTSDTSVAADAGCRAFWAMLCIQVGTRLTLVPTAAMETVRRLGKETERQWQDDLRDEKQKNRTNIREKEIRRIATTASQASRLWLRRAMTETRGPYAATGLGNESVREREGELYAVIPKDIFDLNDPNGITDRKIVVESFARGYDILLTNNQEQVKSEWLAHWPLAGQDRT